ncbi:hypothetical protein GE09DRAFT_679218 [Coniochaeta sp. 2T2.1]|nr:hypothetical protein GE09DRAFT_679218 [Coniochaeta sp. 2T2.1]
MSQQLPIILYHYAYSPYARRVVWYMQLRGIPYTECLQPPILPRPDIARLGLRHRRIPILSIGRDIYLDTRLIIEKLEALYPNLPKLSAPTPDSLALERFLSSAVIDGGIFTAASRLLPSNLPLVKDPKFQKDRADFFHAGVKLTRETAVAQRLEAVADIRGVMELLETTLLADGREWLLKGDKPSLADIEAVWPLHWLSGMPGALPKEEVSAERYPKVFAWIARFQKAVSAAKKAVGKPKVVNGEEAERIIVGAEYNEPEGVIDQGDGLVKFHGLRKGSVVEVWPTDTGVNHKDVGKLVSSTATEVVIETEGGKARVHAPRHGFRVKPAGEGAAKI